MYRLRSSLRGIIFDNEALLLDLSSDRYIGLDLAATATLLQAVAPELLQEVPQREGLALDPAILHQLQEDGIIEASQSTSTTVQSLSRFTQPPGFFASRWSPAESAIADESRPLPKGLLVRALIMLVRTRIILKTSRLRGLNHFLLQAQRKARQRSRLATTVELTDYAEAILRAIFFVPFKVECLLGSAALAALLFQDGYTVQLCIGVRKRPFYAHAWVTYENIILNESPEIQDKLGIIAHLPIQERL